MSMTNLIEIVSNQYGLVGILVFAMSLALYTMWKYYNKQHEVHREEIKECATAYKDEYKGMVGQMFDVVNKNTASHIKLTEAVKDLGRRVN